LHQKRALAVVERYLEYYEMSRTAVPKLAVLKMPTLEG
jgi:hypothetical protein